MRKIKLVTCAFLIGLFTMFPKEAVHAQDFASNEEGWKNKCSIAQSSVEARAQCESFTAYLEQKKSSLNNDLSSMSGQVESLKTNIANISETVKLLDASIAEYQKNIEINDANIRTISEQIVILDENIRLKQEAIDKRNKLIVSRMQAEQVSLGTNVNIEIIMGANDLMDMIRKVNGLQKITDSDQGEIATIKEEKKALDLDKSEQNRLKVDAEVKRAENVQNMAGVEAVKAEQEKAIAIYQQQEASLAEKMRSTQVSIGSLGSAISKISNPESIDVPSNVGGFISPVQGGYLSAGTWYYPGGGAHLGMDMATSIGTPLYAPANGVIVYANNPVASGNGFLGNWVGFPAGGGNTIHMIAEVGGTTYGISFFHLAREGFAVSAGATVSQGQRIASTGNSGNSTGPHCHIELINLGNMGLGAAVAQFQRTADFAWGNGWGDGALNNVCGVKGAPCRMKPESAF